MMAFRTGIFFGCALVVALAGCAHSDLKAPCGPLPLAYASAPEIPEPFKSMDMQMHECGPVRSVNGSFTQNSALIDGKIP